MYQIEPAAYIFTHVYMNTMQQGIQSLHVIGEFIAQSGNEDWPKVVEWARDYKVVKILSAGGGDPYEIAYSEAKMLATRYRLPFTEFIEPDNFSQMTAFGFIITPEACVEIQQKRQDIELDARFLQKLPTDEQMDDIDLIQFLKSKPSAR